MEVKPSVLVATGSLADWGWLIPILEDLQDDMIITVVNVGGYEPSPHPSDYLKVNYMYLLGSDDRTMLGLYGEAAKASGTYLRYGKADKYDAAIVLGDRVEILAFAGAALTAHIPIHHIAAGDMSGCLDDRYRDAISALSNHLYTSNKTAYNACIGLMDWADIQSVSKIKFRFDVDNRILKQLKVEPNKYILARFHPETSVEEPVTEWIEEVAELAIKQEMPLLVFPPNKDDGWKRIQQAWDKMATKEGLELVQVPHLSRQLYLSLLKNAETVVGNSSSFVIEADLLSQYKVRLYGNRQRNRTGPGEAFQEEALDVAEAIRTNILRDLGVKK